MLARAGSRSCPSSCAAPSGALATRCVTTRREGRERGVGVPKRSTNTSRSGRRSRLRWRPASSRQPSRTPRARSHPPIFFSAPSHPLEHPADGRLAHLHPRDLPQVLAPVGQRGPGALLHVGLQELPSPLVHLRVGAGKLSSG